MGMSLPVAYAMKKRAKKMAMGGDTASGGTYESGEEKGINKRYNPDNARSVSEAGRDAVSGAKWERGRKMLGHSKSSIHGELGKEHTNSAKEKHERVLSEMKSMPKPKLMAEGGQIEDNYQSSGNPEVDGGNVCPSCNNPIPHESRGPKDSYPSEDLNQEGSSDEGEGDMNSVPPMIMKIMMGRAKGYSEGGKVSNSDEGELSEMADDKPNNFDDLSLDDNLESENSGKDDGDDLDDDQEDSDRADIISKIMKSRAKKDKNPRPA